MRVTKFTHACVRIEEGERALLIDPGIWTEPSAYEGVDDVLVTHEHVDHVDVEALARGASSSSSFMVRAPAPVAEQLAATGVPVLTVSTGDAVEVAGFPVTVVGGLHAEVYDGMPGCANVGYVVGDRVYHPGDAFFVPEHRDLELMLAPTAGPWLKLSEAIDFVRAVAPRHAVSIHDGLLNERAEGLVDRWMDMKGGTDYRRLAPGSSIDL